LPFREWPKAKVVAEAVRLGVPIGATYSCQLFQRYALWGVPKRYQLQAVFLWTGIRFIKASNTPLLAYRLLRIADASDQRLKFPSVVTMVT